MSHRYLHVYIKKQELKYGKNLEHRVESLDQELLINRPGVMDQFVFTPRSSGFAPLLDYFRPLQAE